MKTLDEKVALVTGATRDIGAGILETALRPMTEASWR
jgi:NAD(P)-dependent dehydrogenase (short-subunit alcohol dehydrogenase family)